MFLIGFAAWGVAVARQPSDYDEVYHAHSVWLIEQGDRPYDDFLALHPPFFWYAASILTGWLPDSPRFLFPMRIFSGLGTLCWLAALCANLSRDSTTLSLRWMLAGLGVALFSTPVLAYAVEFRPDSWAYAFFFSGLFVLRKQRTASSGIRRYALFAFLSTIGTVVCFKVAPFATAFAFFDLLRLTRRGENLRAALLGYVSGVCVALGISWSFLQWMQIDVNVMFQFAFRLQVMFMNNTGYSHGLLGSLTANPLPLLVACAGLFSWGAHTIRTHDALDPFHTSIVAVLVWQLFQVDWPFKQYYGPWLLIAAPLFAYVEPCCRLRDSRDGLRLCAVLVIAGVVGAASLARHRQNESGEMIQRFQEQMASLSDESSPLVAAPPFHAIVRRDVFYAWCRTVDPHGGYTTERALSELGYGDRVSAERYRDELARRDPTVIILPLPGEDLYDPLQWQIISEFLRHNIERYEIVPEGQIRPLALRRRSPRGTGSSKDK